MLYYFWSNDDGGTQVFSSWEKLLESGRYEEGSSEDIFEIGVLLPTQKEFIPRYEGHIFIAIKFLKTMFGRKVGEIEYSEHDGGMETAEMLEDSNYITEGENANAKLVGRYYGISLLYSEYGEKVERKVKKLGKKERALIIIDEFEKYNFDVLLNPSPFDENEMRINQITMLDKFISKAKESTKANEEAKKSSSQYQCFYCGKDVLLKTLLEVDESAKEMDGEEWEFLQDALPKSTRIRNPPFTHMGSNNYPVLNLCMKCYNKAYNKSQISDD